MIDSLKMTRVFSVFAGISRNSYISIVKGNLSPFLIHKINDGQKGKEEIDGNLGLGCMVGRSGATKCAGKPIPTRGGISIRERRTEHGGTRFKWTIGCWKQVIGTCVPFIFQTNS